MDSLPISTDSALNNILENMSYGTAVEAENIAQNWLAKKNKRFGPCTVGGSYCSSKYNFYTVTNPCTGGVLATVEHATVEGVREAVKTALEAFQSWSASPIRRTRSLYSLTRHLQKHQQLLTVLECLNTGRAIHEVKNCDVTQVIRTFYHCVGWASTIQSSGQQWKPIGVVAIILPWNLPLWHLAALVAPALAAGNTVVVKPASATPLSALLFADICHEAGLPSGIYNVVTGPGHIVGRCLVENPDVSQVCFIGSVEVGKELRMITAGSGKRFSADLGGKSAMVVFDSADLDAVIDGIMTGMFFNSGQIASAASRLLIHESVYDLTIKKLKERMKTLRFGVGMNKTIDIGTIFNKDQLEKIQTYVHEAEKEMAEIFQVVMETPNKGFFYPPTLITKVNPGARIVREEVFGPVVVAMAFRTAKEAISLANNCSYGLAASVWTENLALSLEVSKCLKVGTVWINCHNIFDAAAEIGRNRLSGYGCRGGKRGLFEFLQPFNETIQNYKIDSPKEATSISMYGDGPAAAVMEDESKGPRSDFQPPVDITYKAYIGGIQKRPDSNCSSAVREPGHNVIGYTSLCGRKDVRDAVESAHKVQPMWAKRSGHNRLQILYYIAENLQKREEEFIRQMCRSANYSEEDAKLEVNDAIDNLFLWGSYCDKHCGDVQETNLYGVTMSLQEAVGVIGIVCPDENPLLSFVTLMALAIGKGNAVIIVPSEKHPLLAADFYQILDTSDVPKGLISILTGERDLLAPQLVAHDDVDAIWYFGSREGSKNVEHLSAQNMKKTWVNYGKQVDWKSLKAEQMEQFLFHSTQIKTVWMPMGEIFAN